MSSDDEVRRLRHDLDEVMNRTADISQRLGNLEAREGYRAAPVEPRPPERAAPAPVAAARTVREEPAAPKPARPAPTPAPAAPDFWDEWVLTPVGRYFRERMEELRARTRELGWEVQLGTYLLPRVAVVCITIAVVFFLTLAIERWGAQWMPHLRVGIGYAVSAGLMLLAWRSETKYRGLARVLYGGGFAVMYFVTFATHYVRFAQVFASPAPTLILLCVVVAAWAIAAQVRQSKVIAVLVTGLGHLTILLCTLTLARPAPFSMAGIVFLSAGSAFFLLRNRWYYVAVLGMAGSYLNDFVVLARSQGGNPYTDFAGSMGVLSAFLLIFALAELFSPEDLRRTVSAWFRSAFVTANTVAFVLLGTVVMQHFEFTRPHQDLFRFGVAGLLAVLGMAYLHVRSADPLYNVYFTKATVLFTLALATRFGGSSLSAWLAVETVALLVSARRSGLVVMRLLAFGAGCVAFVQSMGAAFQMAYGVDLWSPLVVNTLHLTPMAYTAPGYAAHAIPAALSVAAFLLLSVLYQRTDWTLRSPKSAPFGPDMSAFCWRLDLIAERPASLKEVGKPLGGLLFPYVFALAGAILFFVYTFPLVQGGHRFAVMAGFALALTALAALLDAKPLGLAAVGSLFPAALALGIAELQRGRVVLLPVIIAGLIAAGAAALASEELHVGKRIGLAFHQHAASPYILYGACAWLTGLLLVKEFPGVNGAFALTAAAVAAGGLFLVLHATAFAVISGGFMLSASIVFLPEVVDHLRADPVRIGIGTGVLAGLSLAADRYFSFFRKRTGVAPILCAGFIINAAIVFLCYFEVRIPHEWLMMATALVCYGFLAYAAMFRSPAAAGVSIAGILYASFRHTTESFSASSLHTALIVGFVLLAIFWIVMERLYVWLVPRFDETLERLKLENGLDFKRAQNALAPIALATVLLLVMFERIPRLAHTYPALITISWFAVAAVLFALSLVFSQRFYRYSGLAVIVLSLGRLFIIDMKEQDPLLRVAAFAVVGAGLLAISIGYYKWMARVRAQERDNAAEGGAPPRRDNAE